MSYFVPDMYYLEAEKFWGENQESIPESQVLDRRLVTQPAQLQWQWSVVGCYCCRPVMAKLLGMHQQLLLELYLYIYWTCEQTDYLNIIVKKPIRTEDKPVESWRVLLQYPPMP